MQVIHPQDWDGEILPTPLLVPGGTGSSSGFLSPIPNAQIMADAGLNIVIFNPDGRGLGDGVEDHNGYIHRGGLAAMRRNSVS